MLWAKRLYLGTAHDLVVGLAKNCPRLGRTVSHVCRKRHLIKVLKRYGCSRVVTESWSQVKGLQFPGCHDAKYCRLVLHRSKLLMKPVSDSLASFASHFNSHLLKQRFALIFSSMYPFFVLLSLCFFFLIFSFWQVYFLVHQALHS